MNPKPTRTALNVLIALVIAPLAASLAQTTYYVNGSCGDDAWTGTSQVCQAPNGPKRTIQAGINAAGNGDTVLIADGMYTGPGNRDLDFRGKAITVRSENGPQACTIDCELQGRGFHFHSGEPADAIVQGLTIRGAVRSGILIQQSSPTIKGCLLVQNCGGALRVESGAARVVACAFTENYEAFGAAIVAVDSNVYVRDCRIASNHGRHGGGVYSENSDLSLENCVITGNQNRGYASSGGGLLVLLGTALVTNCVISANSVESSGGGVLLILAESTFINCQISGNSAWSYAGGVDLVGGENTFINCTIAGNTSYLSGGLHGHGDPVNVHNCVVWGNEPNELYFRQGGATVRYSNIRGEWPGVGNIAADPMFRDPANGDYRLSGDSPCIDAGDNTAVPPGVTTDLDGNPRFVHDPCTPDTGNPGPPGPIVDMGAYEFQLSCRADLDGSGIVGLPDLEILLVDFGCTGGSCSGDIDCDDDTDLGDLGILLSNFGRTCP